MPFYHEQFQAVFKGVFHHLVFQMGGVYLPGQQQDKAKAGDSVAYVRYHAFSSPF
jgi:hypothetical protein